MNDNISLVIGIAAYKIHSEEEYIKKSDILSLQIAKSKELEKYSGFALYNYISLFPSESNKAEAAAKQIDNIKKTGGS